MKEDIGKKQKEKLKNKLSPPWESALWTWICADIALPHTTANLIFNFQLFASIITCKLQGSYVNLDKS